IMRSEENLNVSFVCTDSVQERLEYGDAIFRTVAFPAKRRRRQPVRSAVCQVKLAVGIEVFILSVAKASFRGAQHPIILRARRGLLLELLDPDQIVEFLLTHV